MFRKTIALLLCALTAAVSLFPASAAQDSKTSAVVILMNGEPLAASADGAHRYTYVVPELSQLPLLTCRFDRSLYTAQIVQPARENGYTGTVRLTAADGVCTVYTVNVYDENTFQSHFINLGGDPFVTYRDGWYYYMVTGNSFFISKSRELNRVNSNPVLVFSTADLGFNVKELWAPELHYLDGHWYIYFTAYDGDTAGLAKNHRMYVLKSDTDDAQGSYTFMGQLKEVESDYIGDSAYSADTFLPGHFAIDQSVFEWQGKLYAVWSGWKGYTNIAQRIYIAEMSDPYTLSGNRVELSRPEYAYETYSTAPGINEGPQPLISPDGGTLNLAFSVNLFTDSHYALGLLTLKDGGDPLNPDDWCKSDRPVFETSTENSTYSVGHCSFVPSPDGSDFYMIYHARRTDDSNASPREIRVKQFDWYTDGTPCFGEPPAADEPVEIPSGTAMIKRAGYEAENLTLSAAAQILPAGSTAVSSMEADYYSGGSRIALTAAGAQATLQFTAEKTESYTVSLLAAGNSATYCGLEITVNGVSYTKKISGNGSNINNFFWYDLTGIPLNAGENTITVAYTPTYKNGAYLDRLELFSEADAAVAYAAQEERNLASARTPVYLEKKTEHATEPAYGRTAQLCAFSDFDKYWFSSTPFVSEYENTITTCRPGGNKELLASGKEFSSVADFRASLAVTPSAAHTASTGVAVQAENGAASVNSGIIFRVSEMRDFSSNHCPFSGYRCFFIVGASGKIKLQLHQYRFANTSDEYATATLLKQSGELVYNPGDTYIMELEVIGDTLCAAAYNQNDPDTVVTLDHVSLKTADNDAYFDCGKIGLFSNPKTGRVTFSELTVTPLESPASAVSDYGNLNLLSSYIPYTDSASRSHSAANGTITLPTGVSKLIVKGDDAADVADFDASALIRLTNTSGAIQTGFCFRVSDVVSTSPGLTGYAVFLQRTSTMDTNRIVINLTKYGSNGTASNVNLGNQSFSDYNLLSDITDTTQIAGLEFVFNVSVRGNRLSVMVTRADNPALTSGTLSWVIDHPAYTMNKNYPVYYESGQLGIFSNGVAQLSAVRINRPDAPEYSLSASAAEGGSLALSTDAAAPGEAIGITLWADSGYYIAPDAITALTESGDAQVLSRTAVCWDTGAAWCFTQPDSPVKVTSIFRAVVPGDSNADESTDVRDLVRVKKHLADAETISALSNTDLDGNRLIEAGDLTALRRLLIGLS